jgi:hypothetical protein
MSAPTVTVGQVLRLQQQDTTKAPQPKVERPKATATLEAIYGTEQALRFDISLMDQKSTGLKIGDLARWAASSCSPFPDSPPSGLSTSSWTAMTRV